MERFGNGAKSSRIEIDSSPGVASFQQTTSDGSEIHGEGTVAQHETVRGKSRKNRIIFNTAQLNALERLFQDAPYPDMELRTKIADRLDIDESRVTVWFQNRRAKYRRTAKKGTNDSNVDFKKGQINSPASTGSHEPSHGEQSPFAGAGVQDFVQNIPVSGVEFSTWVNHSHSGGDQSTVIYQSRDSKQTFHEESYVRMQGLSTGTSNQQRTLEWLRAQNSQQALPDNSKQPQCNDVQHTSQQLDDIPSQQRRCDIREPIKEYERNESSVDGPATGHSNLLSNSHHCKYPGNHENTGYHEYNSRAPSRNDEHLPPNKDVQELQGNHLNEALERLTAGPSHLTSNGEPFAGVQHSSLQYQVDRPSQIHPYPSPFHVYPSDRPYYDLGFRPNQISLYTQQQHYNLKAPSFYPTQANEWNTIAQNNDRSLPSRTDNLPAYSKSEVMISNDHLPEGGPHTGISSGNHQFPRPSHHQDNRKRMHSSSDESDENGTVRKTRRKKKFRKRRRKIRGKTKTTELSLSELANPNRHKHTQFDSDKEKNVRNHPSRRKENVKAKLKRQSSSSWDEADSSSESKRRSSSSSIFSSTSDSDFEIPFCRLTRNQRVSLSQKCPHNPPSKDLYTFGNAAGSPKTSGYVGNFRPSVSHFEDTTSTVTVSRSDNVASTLHHKDTTGPERIFHPKRNGTEKLSKTEEEMRSSVKEQDFEPSTLLNLLFGPKSPEISSVNSLDEDVQMKFSHGQKSNSSNVVSESLQMVQNCSTPPTVNYSIVHSLSSIQTRSESVSYQKSREIPTCNVGKGTAYSRDTSHRQFTLHYGNNNSTSSMKPQNRPRGIIRPLPQKPSITSGRHVSESTSCSTQGNHFQKYPTLPSPPPKRVTGTVRPWVDDTPRATSNPAQDVSRPVREPVPMEGPPPNKVCTIVKDSLSPIDLLAKYLTWTGSCYTAQKGH